MSVLGEKLLEAPLWSKDDHAKEMFVMSLSSLRTYRDGVEGAVPLSDIIGTHVGGRPFARLMLRACWRR